MVDLTSTTIYSSGTLWPLFLVAVLCTFSAFSSATEKVSDAFCSCSVTQASLRYVQLTHNGPTEAIASSLLATMSVKAVGFFIETLPFPTFQILSAKKLAFKQHLAAWWPVPEPSREPEKYIASIVISRPALIFPWCTCMDSTFKLHSSDSSPVDTIDARFCPLLVESGPYLSISRQHVCLVTLQRQEVSSDVPMTPMCLTAAIGIQKILSVQIICQSESIH